ncbi:hypothetical protein F5Y08DRAFT_346272 [Xylaria arbuscula]|nr:hypothetical protein F5Y08DRAFT_346272 [Xylaria arbuscula]
MTHAPTADNTYSDLQPMIESSLVRSDFTSSRGKDFLPTQSYESLLTRANIRNDLPGASDDLIDFIDKRAKRTFATVLLTLAGFHTNTGMTSIMNSFQQHGFDDNCLPIDEGLNSNLENHLKGCQANPLSVFRDDRLRRTIYTFYTNQWAFLAPKFPLEKNSRTLHRNCILPFTEFGGESKEGTFGEVFPAKLRVDHQKMIQQPQGSGSLDVNVAVKKFKSREKIQLPESEIPDPESAWSNEADKMEELATFDFSECHIAGALGCFSSNGDYYIIMPCATCPSETGDE